MTGFAKPPGPPGYPIIQNLFDMPSAKEMSDEIWAKWGQKWGQYLPKPVRSYLKLTFCVF